MMELGGSRVDNIGNERKKIGQVSGNEKRCQNDNITGSLGQQQ